MEKQYILGEVSLPELGVADGGRRDGVLSEPWAVEQTAGDAQDTPAMEKNLKEEYLSIRHDLPHVKQGRPQPIRGRTTFQPATTHPPVRQDDPKPYDIERPFQQPRLTTCEARTTPTYTRSYDLSIRHDSPPLNQGRPQPIRGRTTTFPSVTTHHP